MVTTFKVGDAVLIKTAEIRKALGVGVATIHEIRDDFMLIGALGTGSVWAEAKELAPYRETDNANKLKVGEMVTVNLPGTSLHKMIGMVIKTNVTSESDTSLVRVTFRGDRWQTFSEDKLISIENEKGPAGEKMSVLGRGAIAVVVDKASSHYGKSGIVQTIGKSAFESEIAAVKFKDGEMYWLNFNKLKVDWTGYALRPDLEEEPEPVVELKPKDLPTVEQEDFW